MRRLHLLPALALALLLAGCALKPLSTEQSLAVTCRSYSATLSSLAEIRADDKLSAEQIDTVNEWRPIANGICTDGTVSGNEYDTLADILRGMSDIETEAKR